MERATKVRRDDLLAMLGVRKIGGDMAEIPEKMRESGHGRNDRRTNKNIMQNVHQNNFNGV
jgi:hypothetical protein